MACVLFCAPDRLAAQSTPAPELYALVVGVTRYEKAELNGLQFPDKDAEAVAAQLKDLGYSRIDLLVGANATKAAIESRLAQFSKRGGNNGIVLVFLSGHGTEIVDNDVGTMYFSPYDTEMKALRDSSGRATATLAPTRESMLAIDDVLLALRESKASSRILITDCCRDDATRSKQMRTKSFGSSSGHVELPDQTLMLLSCKPGQTSKEHDDWGHGALTKCLLEELQGLKSAARPKTMAAIANELLPNVETLVSTKSGGKELQSPYYFSKGRIEIVPKRIPPTPPADAVQDEFTNSLGMVLKRIPRGQFDMGSPETELGEYYYNQSHLSNERQHRVEITRDFYIGVGEVTQAHFEKVMGFNPSWFAPSGYHKDQVVGVDTALLPVERVTWFDAVMFCNKLSESEGRSPMYRITDVQKIDESIQGATVRLLSSGNGYRLPSEAEWEYACRAGAKTAFSFGTELKAPQANFGSRSTRPTGRSAPNAFGLRDMHGNVWEWCWDAYDEAAYSARSGVTLDPVVSEGGSNRVFRGGGWGLESVMCRSAFRYSNTPDHQNADLGFRISIQSVR